MTRVLVAYFSATGTTARAAREVASACDADLFEISPQIPYSSRDLDWTNPKSRSSVEMKDRDCRPMLAEPMPNLSQYDVLVIGFPIWWGLPPRPIDTFLDSMTTQCRVIGFATSGGSGTREALQHIRQAHPTIKFESIQILNGRNPSAWIQSLKL